MWVFLDTSELLKLYVEEPGSDRLAALQDADAGFIVSAIASVEVRSALARRLREHRLRAAEFKTIMRAFEDDWSHFARIHIDDDVLVRAGHLCEKHALRSLDALQLACALTAEKEVDDVFVFLTADQRLESAAIKEKLATTL